MIQYPMTSEGLDRLGTLYSVLAGLPGDRVSLSLFYVSEEFDSWDPGKIRKALDPKHRCGTVACAAGWAAVYPPFNALGLKPGLGGDIKFGRSSNYTALSKFFSMKYGDTCEVFGPRSLESEYTAGLQLLLTSQRRIALHRIRLYLLQQGAIGPQRSAELANSELLQERGYLSGRI